MLTDYLRAAMRKAHYEIIEEDGTFFGSVPGFPGTWASHETLEGCRGELQEVLEEWIMLALRAGDALPVIHGLHLETEPIR